MATLLVTEQRTNARLWYANHTYSERYQCTARGTASRADGSISVCGFGWRFIKVGRRILVTVDQHFANYLPYPFQYTAMGKTGKTSALRVLRILKFYERPSILVLLDVMQSRLLGKYLSFGENC
jgi:hypothetical protein